MLSSFNDDKFFLRSMRMVHVMDHTADKNVDKSHLGSLPSASSPVLYRSNRHDCLSPSSTVWSDTQANPSLSHGIDSRANLCSPTSIWKRLEFQNLVSAYQEGRSFRLNVFWGYGVVRWRYGDTLVGPSVHRGHLRGGIIRGVTYTQILSRKITAKNETKQRSVSFS